MSDEVASVGVDAGSTVLKVVGVSVGRHVVFRVSEPADPRIERQVVSVLNRASMECDFDMAEVPIIATGYGSRLVPNVSRRVTEITCHAKGAFEYFGHGGTLLDIGGQDSKVIVMDDGGRVLDFVMNDKCAAGTGRFLENSAWRLKIPVENMGTVALSTSEEVRISSTCAVFAESEVISRLAHGERLECIIRGLHRSLVKRMIAMINTVGLRSPLMLSGGVAQNEAVRYMIEEELREKPLIPDHPQFIGAFGAALMGLAI